LQYLQLMFLITQLLALMLVNASAERRALPRVFCNPLRVRQRRPALQVDENLFSASLSVAEIRRSILGKRRRERSHLDACR
jgi:hypothetical protein